MKFLFNKTQLHEVIATFRRDKLPKARTKLARHNIFCRIEAVPPDWVRFDAGRVSFSVGAQVAVAGVMFMRDRLFRDLLATLREDARLSLEVVGKSLRLNDTVVSLPKWDVAFYPDARSAPDALRADGTPCSVPTPSWLSPAPQTAASDSPVAGEPDPRANDTVVRTPASKVAGGLDGACAPDPLRREFPWAIEIVRNRFSAGLQDICDPTFLTHRYQTFQAKNDPIYADLLKGMEDEALARTFVSYWTIAHTMATKSRFWLEDAITDIIIHQARAQRRPATHVYSYAMLAAGHFDDKVTIADLGENYREGLSDRRTWRPKIQTRALDQVDAVVGQQERERKPGHDPVPRAWNDKWNQRYAAKDRACLQAVAAAFTATSSSQSIEKIPALSEVTVQCNLIVVEPDKLDHAPHAWAFRFINPKTISNHAARKQERVNLLRLYSLLLQEKPLRDWHAIHISLAELVPRHNDFDTYDHYPDYFSADTYWSCNQLWAFIGVPFRVVTLAIQDVAKEFRDRLKAGLRDLLPDQDRKDDGQGRPRQ
jgi:hypothetical protein